MLIPVVVTVAVMRVPLVKVIYSASKQVVAAFPLLPRSGETGPSPTP